MAAGAPRTEATTKWPAASGRIGLEQGGVEHQHGAGDARHAAGHDDEQFAARERREIRPDEQRRFHHAEKDVGGRRQADRTADAERPFEQPGEAAHDRRQDAPIEQQRGQYAHHQHDRQGLEREDEIGARRREVVGQGAAAEIAEDERRAGPGGGGNRADGIVDGGEGHRHARHLEQEGRGGEGRDEADGRELPRHRTGVLADRPGKPDEREHTEHGLQLLHHMTCAGLIRASVPFLTTRHCEWPVFARSVSDEAIQPVMMAESSWIASPSARNEARL